MRALLAALVFTFAAVDACEPAGFVHAVYPVPPPYKSTCKELGFGGGNTHSHFWLADGWKYSAPGSGWTTGKCGSSFPTVSTRTPDYDGWTSDKNSEGCGNVNMTKFTAATALVSELGSKADVAVDMSCQDFAAPWIEEQLNRSGSGVCQPLSTIPTTYPGEPVYGPGAPTWNGTSEAFCKNLSTSVPVCMWTPNGPANASWPMGAHQDNNARALYEGFLMFTPGATDICKVGARALACISFLPMCDRPKGRVSAFPHAEDVGKGKKGIPATNVCKCVCEKMVVPGCQDQSDCNDMPETNCTGAELCLWESRVQK